jgi:hypothetical protein
LPTAEGAGGFDAGQGRDDGFEAGADAGQGRVQGGFEGVLVGQRHGDGVLAAQVQQQVEHQPVEDLGLALDLLGEEQMPGFVERDSLASAFFQRPAFNEKFVQAGRAAGGV